jgi:hypothetical protein
MTQKAAKPHSSQQNITISHTTITHINHTIQAGPVPPRAQSILRPHLNTPSPCSDLSLPPSQTNENHRKSDTAHIQLTHSETPQPPRVTPATGKHGAVDCPLSAHTLMCHSGMCAVLIGTQPQHHQTITPASMMIGALTSSKVR